MQVVSYIAVMIGAYLVGSIPTGYLVARAKGVDIRTVGSGNIGATNVFRFLGKPAGIFVLVFDGLKGFAACAWFVDGVAKIFAAPPGDEVYLRLVAGLAVVLGHNYTCWLRFKGGKGVATFIGIALAFSVAIALLICASWIVMARASRYSSLAALFAAVLAPIYFLYFGATLWAALMALLAVLIFISHRANIARLIRGEEPQIGAG